MQVQVDIQAKQAEAAHAIPPVPSVPIVPGIKELGAYIFPGEPVAFLKMDSYWLGASRITPWGLSKMKLLGESLIVEERFLNKQPITGIAKLNNFVVVACENSDGKSAGGPHLKLLDPANHFEVVKQAPIPCSLGALSVDSSPTPRIWGSNRANTADSIEEVSYFAFDQDLKLVGTMKAPHRGCQGLVWYGNRLLAVDVFKDALYVVEPQKGYSISIGFALPISYPAGMNLDGNVIYIGDYQTKRIHRFELPAGLAR